MAFLSKKQIPLVLPSVLLGYVFCELISDFVAFIIMADFQYARESFFIRANFKKVDSTNALGLGLGRLDQKLLTD